MAKVMLLDEPRGLKDELNQSPCQRAEAQNRLRVGEALTATLELDWSDFGNVPGGRQAGGELRQ